MFAAIEKYIDYANRMLSHIRFLDAMHYAVYYL